MKSVNRGGLVVFGLGLLAVLGSCGPEASDADGVEGTASFESAELGQPELEIDPSALTGVTPLLSGQLQLGLGGGRGSRSDFSVEVPAGAGALNVRSFGGTGDADLYVRRGALPSSSAYDARAISPGNSQELTVSSPPSGTWYVRVEGRVRYSGLTLVATVHQALTPEPGTVPGAGTTSDAGTATDAGTSVDDANAHASNPAFEDEVLRLVNERRAQGATCGTTWYPPAPPLSLQPQLQLAARLHSVDMATRGYFSHVSEDGRTFTERIRAAGYTGASPMGENIAAGHATPAKVMETWMGSAGHCANILRASYKSLGVGYATDPAAPYRHYWTQDFGGSP